MGELVRLLPGLLLHAFFFVSSLRSLSITFLCAVVRFSNVFSSHKIDEFISALYRQGGSASKLGYFKAVHVKVGFVEQFKDFLEMFKHTILSRVRVKRPKDGSSHEPCGSRKAIKFHPYYFVLGFNFASIIPKSDMLHELCSCSVLSECGLCNGGVLQLEQVL